MAVFSQPLKFPAVGPLGRLSAIMCVVVAVGGALAELVLGWVWLDPARVSSLVVPQIGITGVPVHLDGATRAAGFAVSMVPMLVLIYILHQAYALFDAYRLGNVFSADAAVRLRRIGLGMIGLGFLRPITLTALGYVLTAANPPGQKILSIGVSIDDYMIAAFGGLILAIGHVMVEAKRLADENKDFI